jgi:hypothetical protein
MQKRAFLLEKEYKIQSLIKENKEKSLLNYF